MRELGKPYPDFACAQLSATLSMEETLRGVVAQLAALSRHFTSASGH